MRYFAIILSLFLFAQSVVAGPLSGNAKTKRIPAGTPFQLQLTNSVTSLNSEGTEFTAIMMMPRDLLSSQEQFLKCFRILISSPI